MVNGRRRIIPLLLGSFLPIVIQRMVLQTQYEHHSASQDNTPSRTATRKNNRFYCMVPFIWSPKYLPSYEAIHATWGKRCDVLRFMIDPIVGDNETGYLDLRQNNIITKNYKLPDDVVVITDMQRPWNACTGSENCRNIWEKVWRSLLWIQTNNGDINSAEWFVKVDSDTFLFPENARHYVEKQNWSADDHHYFGHKLWHTDRPGQAPIVAGAAVFFSRATVNALAPLFRDFEVRNSSQHHKQCVDAWTGGEEVVTAICLKKLNISAHHVLDDMGNELISILAVDEVLGMRRGDGRRNQFWYWKKKPVTHPETGKEMHLCCGERPIAFHGYKDPNWLYKIEYELYMEGVPYNVSDDWKELNWINTNQTIDYFERVRKAMVKQTEMHV